MARKKTTTNADVPKGYIKDSQGRLIPIDMVNPQDKERDKLVNALIKLARAEQGRMVALREKANDMIETFIDKAYKKYGAKHGGKKGNVYLTSFDGQYRVSITQGSEVTFNENLQVAKKIIDDCISEWSQGSRQELRVIIDQAFQTSTDGSLSASRILALRKLKIKDTNWNRAMRALNDSVESSSRKPYLRFYEKSQDGEWQNIPLDMSKLAA